MKKLVLALLLITLLACESESSDDKELTELYVDLIVARERYIDNDSLYFLQKKSTLNQYSLTEEEYYSSLNSIKQNSERWEKFFKNAKAYLDTLQKRDTIKTR